jgi:hypothetical protein
VGLSNPQEALDKGIQFRCICFFFVEVLSSMVTKANMDGLLTGVPTSKFGPRVSHLFFADDSLLFCRSSISQWNHLTNILKLYKEASGQRMNNNKMAIFFSKNTTQIAKEEIGRVAGIPITQRYETYLGLPALVGKSRIAAFRSIKDVYGNDYKIGSYNSFHKPGRKFY